MASIHATPTRLKMLRGNPGKRAINVNEPQPELARPDAPEHLSDEARTAWVSVCDHLEKMRMLHAADAHALEALVSVYAQWLTLKRFVQKNGFSYETVTKDGNVMHRAYPEVAMEADAWRRFISALDRFGLSPSSRSRLSVADNEKLDDNPIDEYLNRKK